VSSASLDNFGLANQVSGFGDSLMTPSNLLKCQMGCIFICSALSITRMTADFRCLLIGQPWYTCFSLFDEGQQSFASFVLLVRWYTTNFFNSGF
jgi:hypothetical protein